MTGTSSKLRYDGKVVIVTGAGRGMGRSLAVMFARRGASVLVNDNGCNLQGEGKGRRCTDEVVAKILGFGGEAVANYYSTANASEIVKCAIDVFGRVDILVCNAGILRKAPIHTSTQEDFKMTMQTHLVESHQMALRCWNHFCDQAHGKIILTLSSDAFSGAADTSIFNMSKLALVGLCEQLADKGRRYGITCNAYAPLAITRMTEKTIQGLSMREHYNLHPKRAAPLLGYLCHETCTESGSLFEAGGGWFRKVEFKVGSGCNLGREFRFDAPDTWFGTRPQIVAVVMGAGQGMGALVALRLFRMGACVVAYDPNLGKPIENPISEKKPKLKRSPPWRKGENGSPLLSIKDSRMALMTEGDPIIRALYQFGRVDALVNYAPGGTSCHNNLKSEEFSQVLDQHLTTAYRNTQKAWGNMCKKGYGRILNIAPMSPRGSLKPPPRVALMGLIGLTKSLPFESSPHDIKINTICGSFDPDSNENQLPVSLACLFCFEGAPSQGGVFEIQNASISQLDFTRSDGICLNDRETTSKFPEVIANEWSQLTSFEFSSPSVLTSVKALIPSLPATQKSGLRRSMSQGALSQLR